MTSCKCIDSCVHGLKITIQDSLWLRTKIKTRIIGQQSLKNTGKLHERAWQPIDLFKSLGFDII